MNKSNNSKKCAPDESLCSLLVGFNFLFFTGLLGTMLFLPLKGFFSSAESEQGDAVASTESVTEEVHAAAGEAVPVENAAGKASFMLCTTCHGAEGEGNAALNAPALAGQAEWYLKRQLHNFKDGVRGTHAEDIYGMQMRPMAMTLTDDAKIDEVVAYISTLPVTVPVATLDGDAAKGAASYVLCATCHGPNAEGNEALNAPELQDLPDWYIVRQLQNFKAGIRGTDPKDIYGMQMRPMAMTVPDEQAMKDLAAYINSKASEE
jgi:cytochrome c oxidase subunit 2